MLTANSRKYLQEAKLFYFDELHGFVEVVEHIRAFLCDLVGYVAAHLFRRYQLLLHHGVEKVRKRFPGKVSTVHDAGRLADAFLYCL